ncbi:hypothetical protein AB0N73_09560 [Microbacterium sp. NPDC089189]|uniref:hypothetical protein n=1 Tax=Microbacterium sp. NPDC089189 TaxID=3154972 RepID=UPI00342BA20A
MADTQTSRYDGDLVARLFTRLSQEDALNAALESIWADFRADIEAVEDDEESAGEFFAGMVATHAHAIADPEAFDDDED